MSEVTLRPTTETDLEFVLRAESAPENGRFVVGWSRQRHVSAFGDKDIAHCIVETKGCSVGYLILAGLANPDASIELRRLVIVDKGRGYGRAVVRLVKDLPRALYRDEGFVEKGTLRECVRAPGGFESLVVMSQLRDEYEHGRET